MSGAVLMTLPSAKPPALVYADSMTRDLNRAAQNAMTAGSPYGFGLSPSGYSIYAFENEVWTPVNSADTEGSVAAALEIEGAPVKDLPESGPLIVFEPTGMNRPFSVMVSGDKARFEVIADGAGKTVMREL